MVRLVGADYSLTMQLSAALVSQGDAVSVTCEIHQTAHDDWRQRDHSVAVSPPPTLLFVKKIRRNDSDDVDVKLASNHVVESLFQRSGRYRILHNHTDQLRRVRYTLKISSQYILAARLHYQWRPVAASPWATDRRCHAARDT